MPPIKSAARSTLGIMLSGNVISNLCAGGPAFTRLHQGDTVVRINGVGVDESNIFAELGSTDQPGEVVKLTVIKHDTERTEEVQLVRMSSEDIADRCRLMELFTEQMDLALAEDDQQQMERVQEAIELCTSMLLEDSIMREKARELRVVHEQAQEGIQEMASLFEQLQQAAEWHDDAHAEEIQEVTESKDRQLAEAQGKTRVAEIQRNQLNLLVQDLEQKLVEANASAGDAERALAAAALQRDADVSRLKEESVRQLRESLAAKDRDSDRAIQALTDENRELRKERLSSCSQIEKLELQLEVAQNKLRDQSSQMQQLVQTRDEELHHLKESLAAVNAKLFESTHSCSRAELAAQHLQTDLLTYQQQARLSEAELRTQIGTLQEQLNKAQEESARHIAAAKDAQEGMQKMMEEARRRELAMKEEAATLKLQVKRASDDKDQLHALHDRVQRELLAETNALQGKLEDADRALRACRCEQLKEQVQALKAEADSLRQSEIAREKARKAAAKTDSEERERMRIAEKEEIRKRSAAHVEILVGILRFRMRNKLKEVEAMREQLHQRETDVKAQTATRQREYFTEICRLNRVHSEERQTTEELRRKAESESMRLKAELAAMASKVEDAQDKEHKWMEQARDHGRERAHQAEQLRAAEERVQALEIDLQKSQEQLALVRNAQLQHSPATRPQHAADGSGGHAAGGIRARENAKRNSLRTPSARAASTDVDYDPDFAASKGELSSRFLSFLAWEAEN